MSATCGECPPTGVRRGSSHAGTARITRRASVTTGRWPFSPIVRLLRSRLTMTQPSASRSGVAHRWRRAAPTDRPAAGRRCLPLREARGTAAAGGARSGRRGASQQRESVKRRKGGPSARRYRSQPVRHWDEWLHQNPDLPCNHLLACDADGADCVDLTPGAHGEFAIDPGLDISADGARAVATQISLGKDRELDSVLLLIELASGSSRIVAAAASTLFEEPEFSPDGLQIAASARSAVRAGRASAHRGGRCANRKSAPAGRGLGMPGQCTPLESDGSATLCG